MTHVLLLWPTRSATLRAALYSALLTALSVLTGCAFPAQTASPGAQPTLEQPSDETVWQAVAPGIEKRTLRVGGSLSLTSLTALRLDPSLVEFRVAYSPAQPLNASEWREALPGAAAIVNGGFFSEGGEAIGLLVSDGAAYGQSLVGYGGMFQVTEAGPRVRSLIAEPYAGEPLLQAAQAFPMLMLNGAASYAPTAGDTSARRVVIAQDTAGRIVILVTSSLFGMRLSDLSTFLAGSDLGLMNALNLDGGGSTMLIVDGAGQTLIPSIDAVPAVIAVYPREAAG